MMIKRLGGCVLTVPSFEETINKVFYSCNLTKEYSFRVTIYSCPHPKMNEIIISLIIISVYHLISMTSLHFAQREEGAKIGGEMVCNFGSLKVFLVCAPILFGSSYID